MERNWNQQKTPFSASSGRTTLVFVLIVIGLIAYGLFFQEKGSVETVFNDDFFAIATEDEPIFIRYTDVESVERIDADGFDFGQKLDGREGKRYLQGIWHNETLGEYRLSVNTRSASFILLRWDGKAIVFSGNKTEQTDQYFKTLSQRVGRNDQ